MKNIIIIFLLCFISIGFSQNEKKLEEIQSSENLINAPKHLKEYFNNGNLKSLSVFENEEKKIIKTFYKNGQLRFYENKNEGLVEEFYKTGVLNYQKI